MSLFNPCKLTNDKLSDLPIKEGQLIVTTDTKKLYVDVSPTERIEVAADAEVDLSDYVTTSILTSTVGEEASARQKQDQLLEQAIEDKVGADDIVAGSNIQVNHDDVSGHITISATDTNTNTTYTLSKSGSTITLSGSDGSSTSVTDANTTYTLGSFGITASADELNKLDGVTATATELNYVDGVTSNIQTQLNGKAASSHTHSNATTTAAGFLPKLGGGTTNYLRADGTWAKPPDTNTTYSNMTGASASAAGKAGLVPAPAAGTATRYLRSDGTWQVPPDTNTTYSAATTSSAGLMSAADKTKLDGIAAGANKYTLPVATTSALGGVRIGFPESGKNYPVELNSSNQMFVNVPWTDTNTTYTLSSFGITATAAELNKLDGVTATATELNYVDGVTSNIQTQLNRKAASSHTHSYLPLSGGTLTGTLTSRAITPSADSTYDIGTSTVRYRNVYADTITASTFNGSISNAVTATQANYWTTARTLTFTGDVTGSVSIKGNANMSCAMSLAANSVTANEIAANAVGTSEIAANAVGTSEIAANAVTLAKLGSDVGTVAVQTKEPTDSNIKLWIKI